MPDLAAIDMRTRRAAARPLAVAAGSSPPWRETAGARRAGAALPQPPRLCAADAVPGLRPPLPVPELHGLAGRAPLPPGARLPPLRPYRAPARDLPRMRRGREPDRLRAGRGAAGRGGGGALPGPAHAGPVLRLPRRHGAAAARAGGRGGGRVRASSSARSSSPRATISRSCRWSAWSTPISASPRATRARRSAPSRSCSR